MSAFAPSPPSAARRGTRPAAALSCQAACSTGVTRAATITVRHSGTGAPATGFPGGGLPRPSAARPAAREAGGLRGAQRPLARPQCSTLRRRSTDHANHGKESRKFNQGCTICHSCRYAISDFTVSKQPEHGIRMAGIRIVERARVA